MTTRELMTVGFWSDDDWALVVEPEKETKSAKVDVDSKQDVTANNAHSCCLWLGLFIVGALVQTSTSNLINIVLLPNIWWCVVLTIKQRLHCVSLVVQSFTIHCTTAFRRRGSTFLSFSIVVGVNSKMLKWILYRIKWWRCTNAFRLKSVPIQPFCCCDIFLYFAHWKGFTAHFHWLHVILSFERILWECLMLTLWHGLYLVIHSGCFGHTQAIHQPFLLALLLASTHQTTRSSGLTLLGCMRG